METPSQGYGDMGQATQAQDPSQVGGQPTPPEQAQPVTAEKATIEADRQAIRNAILATASDMAAAQSSTERETYGKALLAACQGLSTIDPSLHPQTQAQGPGSREGAQRVKP
jgi:hypothetical protein